MGIGEGFDYDGADWKIECCDGVIGRLCVFGEFDESVFGCVVGEEWGVDVVGYDV